MEKIVHAAIQYIVQGRAEIQMVVGKRHGDCMKQFQDMGLKRVNRAFEQQGFVTDTGRFLSRLQACDLALLNGQYSGPRRQLFSEDLW